MDINYQQLFTDYRSYIHNQLAIAEEAGINSDDLELLNFTEWREHGMH